MTDKELFATAVREIDKTAGAPEGPYQLVARNRQLHAQSRDARGPHDTLILTYYKGSGQAHLVTRHFLALYNNITKFKKAGVL